MNLLINLIPVGVGLLIFTSIMLIFTLFSSQGEALLDRLTGQYTARLKPLFESQQIPLKPGQFILIQVGSVLLFFALGLASGPDILTKLMMGALLAVVGLILPLRWLKDQQRRRDRKFAEQFADASALIGNSVRSGLSLLQALEVLVREMEDPMAYEVYQVLQNTRVGLPVDAALEQWAARMNNSDLNIFTTAVVIQRQTGGDLGHVLNTLASTIRQRQKIQGQIQALTAQGRMGAVVLAGLPVFMGVVLYFINPERMRLFFTEPMGWGMLGISAVTLGAGFFIIRRIVEIDI